MLLAIDIGNTNIVLGCIENDQILFQARIATDRTRTSDQYGVEIKNCIAKKSKNLYVPNEQSLNSAYHRLERDGFIKGKWGDETVGVKRKYYTITEDGVKYFRSLKGEWQNAKILLDILMNEEL